MANRPYQKSLGKRIGGASTIAPLTDTLKIIACSSAYTPDTTSTGHEFLSDVGAGARLGTATIASKTISSVGVFDAADTAITGVTGTVTQFVIYKDTGTEGTSPLMDLIDTATGLPTAALAAQSVTVGWDNGASKIYKVG